MSSIKDKTVFAQESVNLYNACKEAGKIRTEGKGYYPKDGDIVFFRFNVNKKA